MRYFMCCTDHLIVISMSDQGSSPPTKISRTENRETSKTMEAEQCEEDFSFPSDISLNEIRSEMSQFVSERSWDKFHTPRNLLIALTGEVGELAEIFQWKGEVSVGIPELSERERQHVGEELSDVLFYLVRMAQQCHVDLPAAARAKMLQNRAKYPAHVVRGSSRKYTEYSENNKENCECTVPKCERISEPQKHSDNSDRS